MPGRGVGGCRRIEEPLWRLGCTKLADVDARLRALRVKEKVAPVRVQERIAVGARLPADVELRSVPSTWGPKFSKYRYVYSDDRVYLVEPSNRTVIQVID